MVGMLQSGEVDITLSELAISKERNDIIDFTHPILTLRYFF